MGQIGTWVIEVARSQTEPLYKAYRTYRMHGSYGTYGTYGTELSTIHYLVRYQALPWAARGAPARYMSCGP